MQEKVTISDKQMKQLLTKKRGRLGNNTFTFAFGKKFFSCQIAFKE